MNDQDLLGFPASGLVLTTFGTHDMLSLRLVAIASNVAFVSYGYVAHIVPVLLLHTFLLPPGSMRLNGCLSTSRILRTGLAGVPTLVRRRLSQLIDQPSLPGNAK